LEVPGHPELENDENLVCRVAGALIDRLGEVPPTTITLHKAIPIAAGLGGGSADAAATLVGLNALWSAGLAPKQLVEIGASISSDVPAILVGGLVHASGRGERVRNVGSFDDGWLVIGAGAEHVSAADAYAVFDRIGSVRSDAWAANDLEGAACELVPGLRDRIDAMREVAHTAFVSGSGPTVIGVMDDEAAATRAAGQIREHFADVLLAQPSPWGVRLTLRS
jgi:4-diphosphocytidyl-2-C-methyl-D-erythritol kinase